MLDVCFVFASCLIHRANGVLVNITDVCVCVCWVAAVAR